MNVPALPKCLHVATVHSMKYSRLVSYIFLFALSDGLPMHPLRDRVGDVAVVICHSQQCGRM